MIEIYLVRHGETKYNQTNLLIGGKSNHLPLNEKGILQSKKLGKYFLDQDMKFDFCFCSTAIRARQTLASILEYLSLPKIEFSEEIEELSQGIWEGQLRSKIHTAEQLKVINSDNYDFKAPEGESQREVEIRMYSFLEQQINKIKKGRILVVSHGTAIKCLLRKILDASPSMTHKIKISNTGLTKLIFTDAKGWELEYVNHVIQTKVL